MAKKYYNAITGKFETEGKNSKNDNNFLEKLKTGIEMNPTVRRIKTLTPLLYSSGKSENKNNKIELKQRNVFSPIPSYTVEQLNPSSNLNKIAQGVYDAGKETGKTLVSAGKELVSNPIQSLKTFSVSGLEGVDNAHDTFYNLKGDFLDFVTFGNYKKNPMYFEDQMKIHNPNYGTNLYQKTDTYKAKQSGELSTGQQSIYQIGQNIGNMAPSIAFSMAAGPTAGSAFFFLQAQQNYTEDARARGYSGVKARTYGVIMGGTEVLVERIGFDQLGGLNKLSKGSVLKSMGGEALEEFVMPYIDGGVKTIYGEEVNWDNVHREAVESAAYGAVIGGILNLGGKGLSKVDVVVKKVNNNQSVSSAEMTAALEEIEQTNPGYFKEIMQGLDKQTVAEIEQKLRKNKKTKTKTEIPTVKNVVAQENTKKERSTGFSTAASSLNAEVNLPSPQSGLLMDKSTSNANNIAQSNNGINSNQTIKPTIKETDLSYQGTNHSGDKASGRGITVDKMSIEVEKMTKRAPKTLEGIPSEALEQIRKAQNNPEAKITIYRGSPKGEINVGDWVFLSETQAEKYTKGIITGTPIAGYEVGKLIVKAKDVDWTGKNLEFVYSPNTSNLNYNQDNIKQTKGNIPINQNIFENQTNEQIRIKLNDTIDSIYKGVMPKGNQVLFTDVPQILNEVGVKDLPTLASPNTIRNSILTKEEAISLNYPTGKNENYHGLGKAGFNEVLNDLNEPVAIIKENSNKIIVLTEQFDYKNNQIIVPIEINTQTNYNTIRLDANVVLSAHGRKSIGNYLNNLMSKNSKIVYKDTKKIQNLIDSRKVQYPESIGFVSDNTIAQNDKKVKLPIVNTNNMQNTEKNTNNMNSLERTAPPIKNTDKHKLDYIPKDPTRADSYDTPTKITRKQVKQQLINEMGINSIELSKGNDISSVNYQITDPIRINEKVFGKKLGDKINAATIERTKHNTAEKTRWLNQERNDLKKLGIKARSKESAAVQKYGEQKYVNEYGEEVRYTDNDLATEFPNRNMQEKIKKAAEVIRHKYDRYIDDINKVITAIGYDPIPKRSNYMRHFQELGDIFSQTGTPFNLNDMQAEDLPTDINGLTEFNKPGKNWFASAEKRTGIKTTYDAITGVDVYLEGAGNLIYHTEDIQRYRALSSLIRDNFGQSKGFENLDNLTDEEVKQRIKDIQNNKLSKYVAWLDEQANNLAGKKGAIDRGVERMIGRKGYTFMNTLKKQVGSNMTGFNISSSLTNLISSTMAAAKTNKVALVKGTISTINNMFHNDSFIDKSDFLTSRFGSDQLSSKLWQKAANAGQIFMRGTDYFTANQIVRSKYFEGLQKGLSESEAIKYADDFGSRVMGDRSQGSTAEIFNSKTMGLFTQFQLEVNNQWQYMFHDTKVDYQLNSEINGGLKAGATVLFQLGQLAAYSYLFNELFEALTGRRAAFDLIEILKTLFGSDDEDEELSFEQRLYKAAELLIDNIPFGNLITGGGRIPISEALTGGKTLLKKITNQKDDYGNEITWEAVGKDVLETIPYYILPTGYNQIKKSINGTKMYDKNLPIAGSYTDSGNLRFEADESTIGKVKAFLFGPYSSKEAQDYIDSGFKTINKSRLDEMKKLKMSSSEYRDYRNGLSKAGTTNKEKINYISNLGVSSKQKSIMMSNLLGRNVDYSEYKKYNSYEEFDYAYKNPEKYQVITQITTYDKYLTYQDEIDIIKEKYTNTTQRKAAVIKYVNSLDLSIAQKAMLIKLNYSSYDSYDVQIIKYVNSQDLSKNDKKEILVKLGFTVRNGKVYA